MAIAMAFAMTACNNNTEATAEDTTACATEAVENEACCQDSAKMACCQDSLKACEGKCEGKCEGEGKGECCKDKENK